MSDDIHAAGVGLDVSGSTLLFAFLMRKGGFVFHHSTFRRKFYCSGDYSRLVSMHSMNVRVVVTSEESSPNSVRFCAPTRLPDYFSRRSTPRVSLDSHLSTAQCFTTWSRAQVRPSRACSKGRPSKKASRNQVRALLVPVRIKYRPFQQTHRLPFRALS